MDDVCNELSDVIVMSMVALASVSDEPGEIFAERLQEIADRSRG